MRTAPGYRILGLALLGAATAAAATAGKDTPTPPATSPSATVVPPATRPATFSLRGQVKMTTTLDIQKPNFSRVVVYLASDPRLDAMPMSDLKPCVSQQDKTFVPNFLVVRRGAEVEFPNRDRFEHNVFSRSAAAPAFDLERYPYGQSKSRVFDKVGVVQVFCNIHSSMRAIIVVTPNAFATRVDAQGRFEINDVPSGHYEVVAWQERCEEQRRPVDVGPGPSAEISLTLEESRKSILANNPPERRGEYGVERGLGIKRERLDLPVVTESHPAPAPDAAKH